MYMELKVANGVQCLADYVYALLSLVFGEVFEDPSPFVEDDSLPR